MDVPGDGVHVRTAMRPLGQIAPPLSHPRHCHRTSVGPWPYGVFMAIKVVRRYRFEAAHRLTWHAGKCRRLHGHSYVLEVEVAGPLDEHGIVMDFAEVDEAVDGAVLSGSSGLDHAYLNDLLANPTAELLAVLIGDRLDAVGLAWTRLRLWETEDGSVVLER